MTDDQVIEWNEALRSGDAELIDRVKRKMLDAIHWKIMNDDRYQERTHG